MPQFFFFLLEIFLQVLFHCVKYAYDMFHGLPNTRDIFFYYCFPPSFLLVHPCLLLNILQYNYKMQVKLSNTTPLSQYIQVYQAITLYLLSRIFSYESNYAHHLGLHRAALQPCVPHEICYFIPNRPAPVPHVVPGSARKHPK